MIVVFHGTKLGKHGAAAAMVAIGSMEAFRTNKKVILMSFCSSDPKNNIENLANRQVEVDEKTQSTIAALEGIEYDDSGVDALVRRAETGKLMAEHFDNAISPMIRTKNGLDLCNTTKDDGFEDNIDSHFDVARTILGKANTIYDYVFVLADPDNKSLTQQLDRLADKVVCVVRQGHVDKTLPFLFEQTGLDKVDKRGNSTEEKAGDGRKKLIFLVADYEEKSAYNIRVMKKQYGNATICIIPHNVKYRDASSDGVLVRFASRNAKINKNPGDYNYSFSIAINKLLDTIAGYDELKQAEKEEEETADLEAAKLHDKKKQAKAKKKLDTVEPEQVVVEEKQEKKGLFGKPKTYESAVINMGQNAPADEETPEPVSAKKEKTKPVKATKTGKHSSIGQKDMEEAFEPEPEAEEKPKKKGGLFGFGKKKEKAAVEPEPAKEEAEEDDIEEEVPAKKPKKAVKHPAPEPEEEYDEEDYDEDEDEEDEDESEEYDDEEEEEEEPAPKPVRKQPVKTAKTLKTVRPAAKTVKTSVKNVKTAARPAAKAATVKKLVKTAPEPAVKAKPASGSGKSTKDQMMLVVKMRNKGVSDDLIADALGISEDRVAQLAAAYEAMQ